MSSRSRAERVALGIDLGGTKILAGIVDRAGRILGRGKLKTPFRGDRAALGAALVAAADAALGEAHLSRERVAHLAVAAPGPLDAGRGVLLRAGNLAVKNFDVIGFLATAFPGAVRRLENDVRLAALAEARLGAGRGARTMVAFWVGTGVGGAVILNGRIHTGRNGNAGEVGQMFLDFRRARPGETDGSLEQIAAKVGITAYLRRKIEEGEKTVLAKIVKDESARLKGSELRKAVQAGDPLTLKAVRRSARAVGLAMGNVFDVLSPDLFVLGGGVAVDLGEPYLAEVKKWARGFAFTTELGSIEVVPAALGDDAGILGAALYARERPG